MIRKMEKIFFIFGIICLLLFINLPDSSTSAIDIFSNDVVELPDPLFMDITIDEIIQKRTSVREFTDESVTLEELSTILWAAYGIRGDGTHSVLSIKGSHAVKIYILNEDGIYRYEPSNHSLIFYKTGDFRYIGQYEAPIQFGLIWDKSLNSDENVVGAEIGEVGQNIYHSCIAIGLGTVTTAEVPSPLQSIGLPQDHVGRIVMPIGHPTMETKYFHLPMWISFLPRIKDSSIALSTVIENWEELNEPSHESISKQLISQFLWACYGYSYYLDHSGFEMHFIERHRTVPSAHAYYPLQMYAITSSGIYKYIAGLTNSDPIGLPIVTFLWKIKNGDLRSEIAGVTDELVNSAPLSIVITLNIDTTIQRDDLSDPSLRWIWTYEAGACAQNVMLNTEAWGYSSTIIPIDNPEQINSILGLNDNYEPFYILSIG
jgi:nitroreductase